MTDAMFLVLVVEDDPAIREIIRTLLVAQGYRLIEADRGERAIIDARNCRPDLVIVDLGLPDRDGQEVIKAIRTISSVPILVLSARTAESEKIVALDNGADDYVTKPFSAPELLARVRAAVRRSARNRQDPPTFDVGAVEVNLATRSARDKATNGAIHLTPIEFRLLDCLSRNAGLIVTQDQLIKEVWGPDRQGDARGLRTYIKHLRLKLEPDPRNPRFLLTELGVGYRLLLTDALTEFIT